MANYFDAFLGGVLGKGTQFKDFQHASRLYVDELYALAPKQGFLYYVVLNINQAALPASQWKNVRQREIGLLVKACDLPKFTMATEVLNQYNRKTYAQSKITYNTVSFTFHDDHSNVTTNLWRSYYGYYFADSKQASGSTNLFALTTIPPGYKDTKYQTNVDVFHPSNYGLNNKQDKPFFDSIEIYQLNRKKFTSFILLNPMVTEWSHDKLDQNTNNKLLENKMTVGYEAVLYGEGYVKRDKPSGFATFHYDMSPSPLSILGGGTNNIFGPGGMIDGANELFGNLDELASGNGSPLNILNAALAGGNLIRNSKNLTGGSFSNVAMGLLAGGIGLGGIGNLPTSLSAGSNTIAGMALSLFKGKSSNTLAGASQANVTYKNSSQVSQASVFAFPSGGDVTINTDIPQPLPTDAASLSSILASQQSMKSQLEEQVSTNTALKDNFDSRIATAKENMDDEGLNAIYDEMNSKSYTDPDKLSASLTVVENNLVILQSSIDTAESTDTASDTLSKDSVELGTSPDATLDDSVNPDYIINTDAEQVADDSDSYPQENYDA